MTAPDERVWLQHPEHGGYFACPAGAVEVWTSPEMGWQLADNEPEEHNPVIAENLAAREEQARAEAKPKPRSKTWSKSDADTTPEGN